MRERMVHRYYCDFCGKGGCHKGHMAKHERGCTKNVNRVCGICARIGGKQKTADELVAAFRSGADKKASMENLREACENCPCCILMTLRILFKPAPFTNDPDDQGQTFPPFNFKQELAEFWREENSARAESDGNQGVYY